MSPRQFVWLRERHKQEVEYQELLWAINTSTLANHSFAQPKKAYKPYDFMPSKIREKAANEPKKRFTRKAFAEQLVAMRKAMPLHFVVRGEKQKTVLLREDSDGTQTTVVE